MNSTVKAVAGIAILVAVAGCVDDPGPSGPISSPATPAQQACLRDVARTTGNSDVSVISSSFSEAGTEVIVRVGPTGRWSCIAYSDGSTAGIESQTDEGAL